MVKARPLSIAEDNTHCLGINGTNWPIIHGKGLEAAVYILFVAWEEESVVQVLERLWVSLYWKEIPVVLSEE